ncbi:glutamate dehydrogenase [Flavobacterium sp. H122]|uniref:THC0290_0291 family protein n=1 Tax=Flavobacterium sp. H122 TaxID=2529860 RepID=UPI0010AA18B6|nr:glutamate dehydrogenase [Flavobacterium sp. H122]
MPKLFRILILFLVTQANSTFAQLGFSHEVGIITGPVAFQSDYGERHDFDTNKGNTGLGIGLVHYMNFSYRADCNCYTPETYFNDHFKVRSELSYNKTNLNHFGHWVDPDKTSTEAQQLRGMQGSTAVTNIGMQLEYYPFSIRNFTASTGSWAPYVSLGGQYSFYKPEVYTTFNDGSLLNPDSVYYKYWDASEGKPHGFSNDRGSTWSIVSSIGTRYKLSPLSDLVVDLRWQYYFDNWVDGLNPNPDLYKENKANDWNVWLNFGYIYYLD